MPVGTNVIILLTENSAVAPVWQETPFGRELTYQPTMLIEQYVSNVIPRVGEHTIISGYAHKPHAIHARVVAVAHHWSKTSGPEAHVIVRCIEGNAPIQLD